MNNNAELIPESSKGASSDTLSFKEFKTKEEAIQLFELAKKRLLDVSNWDKICSSLSAKFMLTDSRGKTIENNASEGNYFRIDIPAPGSENGHGYDWVRIEKVVHENDINKDSQSVAIKVHPSKNPIQPSAGTAHFFKEDASSTFMVKREKNKVTAEIHGRNELPNLDQENKKDIIRNAIVAFTAMLGFSKVQWKQLTEGLLADD